MGPQPRRVIWGQCPPKPAEDIKSIFSRFIFRYTWGEKLRVLALKYLFLKSRFAQVAIPATLETLLDIWKKF